MQRVVYDSGLEDIAKQHASQCVYAHRGLENRIQVGKRFGWGWIGENMGYSTWMQEGLEVFLSKQLESFIDEKNGYDYKTDSCTHRYGCKHYTQIIWASTTRVGCAVQNCVYLHFDGQWKRYYEQPYHFLVCNYGEGGNTPHTQPYEKCTKRGGCPTFVGGGTGHDVTLPTVEPERRTVVENSKVKQKIEKLFKNKLKRMTTKVGRKEKKVYRGIKDFIQGKIPRENSAETLQAVKKSLGEMIEKISESYKSIANKESVKITRYLSEIVQ